MIKNPSKTETYTNKLIDRINDLEFKNSAPVSVGVIESVKDFVLTCSGLSDIKINEIVEIEIGDTKIAGFVFDLRQDFVGVLMLEPNLQVKAGQKIVGTGKSLTLKVNYNYLGRVVDGFGAPLDGSGIDTGNGKDMPIEKIAPGVMKRESVTRPFKTGILVIDSLVNIGKGQRELIIGDRQSGKSTIAIDTILNQKNNDVICIYVAVGQKKSKVKQIVEKFTNSGASDYTIVVNSSSSDPVSLQYLAPYTGMAIAEYFCDLGRDVLVVFDDLTKHAWAYRQLSLLFRRPPGREAFPGDVFYLHSRLLERSLQFNQENGGGSITALPIVETLSGDVSAYIPTNVISITDGQIFLESDLFNNGIRPAINPGVSVTRVGGAAQPKNLKKVSGSIKLELAQYRELAAFSKFGGDLEPATAKRLTRGANLTQAYIQSPNSPYSLSTEVFIIYAAKSGFIDHLSVKNVVPWIKKLVKYIEFKSSPELNDLLNDGKWDSEIENQVKTILNAFIATA